MPKFGAQRKMIDYDLFIVSFFKVYFNSIFSHTKKMGSARFYRISYKSAKNGHDAKRDKGYYGQIQNIIQQLWHDVFFFQKSDLNEYSKASRYTASSCTDLDNARFCIGSKKQWDARFLKNCCLRCTFFWEARILINIFLRCTDFLRFKIKVQH